MRASKVIQILEHENEQLLILVREYKRENDRLREALLRAADKPAAASALRPRKEDEEKVPVPRPLGL